MCDKNWPDLRENLILQEVAEKHKKSVVQVMLQWGIQRGCAVIPKSTSLKNQKENIEILDFNLSEEEIEKICSINENKRLCNFFDEQGPFDVFA